ncbi:hypothetical protein [Bradyrhizobium sp.]|uniref:hypothetical protein n=1 Tax=Bradyrhizobium sp. TaxID=376 RepID=UPI0039E402BB
MVRFLKDAGYKETRHACHLTDGYPVEVVSRVYIDANEQTESYYDLSTDPMKHGLFVFGILKEAYRPLLNDAGEVVKERVMADGGDVWRPMRGAPLSPEELYTLNMRNALATRYEITGAVLASVTAATGSRIDFATMRQAFRLWRLEPDRDKQTSAPIGIPVRRSERSAQFRPHPGVPVLMSMEEFRRLTRQGTIGREAVNVSIIMAQRQLAGTMTHECTHKMLDALRRLRENF